MLIYLDSCILIYFFDHSGPLNSRATNRLAQMAGAGDQVATSDLVRLECRVKPLQLGDVAKLAAFDSFFSRSDVRRAPLSSTVFDQAATIRAAFGFKLGDSLHLAAAVEARCDSFLTNDFRLAAFNGIAIEVLP